MQKVIEELANRALEQDKNEHVDVIIKMCSAQYDKAAAYTNLVVIAGYAAAFTIWSNMKDSLPEISSIIVAAALTISCTCFVFWEVYKMIVTSKGLANLVDLSKEPIATFHKKRIATEKEANELNVKLLKVWARTILPTTIAFAGIAILTLLVSFVMKLAGNA